MFQCSGRVPVGQGRRHALPSGLSVVVRTLPTGSVTSCHSQPSESDVVHDHIRLRQHQIVAITYIGVRVGALHMKYTGTTESDETVGGSPGGGELSSGGGSTKMISDSCSYANRKVVVKRVGEYLLSSAQSGVALVAGRFGSGSIRLSESFPPVLPPRST